jgi:predicted transposase/invertase (TIGR01784 family)
MPLGIRPIVDFVFKKIFGSPENAIALLGLLNAILRLKHPVVAVEILNPFNYQEFTSDKQIVLDVRARDSLGRWFNVEMQISVFGGLLERLVYYPCSLYVDQLSSGDDYAELCPAISICLLDNVLFRDTSQPHHHFELIDQTSGLKLDRAIAVHTVELSKYNSDEATISTSSKLEQWVFLLRRAHEYSGEQLRRLLPGLEFERAIQVIEIISSKTEDRTMYDQREKAQRDYEWAISGAREEGREEGKLAGRIQLLQELLGERPSQDEELRIMSHDALSALVAELQTRLRSRDSES